MLSKFLLVFSLLVILVFHGAVVKAKTSEPLLKVTGKTIKCREHSFRQFQTIDKLGREITFYITVADSTKNVVPLVVYITGSGGDSVFSKGENDEVDSDYSDLLNPIQEKARLLIVEKPGVKLFAQANPHGTGLGCPEEFLREHTLDRWTEAINASIAAARTMPEIDQKKLLVVGHSEGGQVAPHVAATNANVTHVANIAGGGPTQLFDMMIFAQNDIRTDPTMSSTAAMDDVIKTWREIVSDKDSYTKMWSGHTYRRWYSFCSNSPMEDLLKCSAKAYLVQGTQDTSTPVVSFDVMQAVLLGHGRDFVAERIEGADHGLRIMDGDKVDFDKRPEVMARIVDWFLAK